MSFVPLFTVTQVTPSPSVITINDVSTGTDSAIASRVIYLQKADGTYLVPTGVSGNAITWSLSAPTTTSIGLNVLSRDFALSILVQWLDSSGNILYSTSSLYAFTLNTELFYYALTQMLAANNVSIRDTDYYYNKMVLRVSIDEANNAVNYGSDIKSSQDALDRAYYLVQNKQIFFLCLPHRI